MTDIDTLLTLDADDEATAREKVTKAIYARHVPCWALDIKEIKLTPQTDR